SLSTDNHKDFPVGATIKWVVEDFEGTFVQLGMVASHTFETVGAYTVTLRITDAAGNEDTDTLNVYVRDTEAPVALDIVLSAVDEDEMVEINLKPFISDNDPTFFEFAVVDITLTDPWDQQTKASGLSPMLEFETPGLWTANATISDAAGNTISVEFGIFVNDITSPTVVVEAPGPFIDEDTEVTFDASGSTDNDPDWPENAKFSWSWEPVTYIGDDLGGEATGPQPSITFTTPGEFTVTLIVEDASGNTASWEDTIVVLDTTAPEVDIGDDRTVDEDTLVFFDVTVTDNHPLFPMGAETFLWTIEDGTGAEWELYVIQPNFIFIEPGDYTVTCDVTDAWGNTGSDSIIVTVADTTAPGGVSDLIVDDKGLGKVILEWSPSTDSDVAGYRIYRRQGSTGEWEMVAELGPTLTSYSDGAVEPGKTYRYRVEAFDGDGNEAPPTEQAHQTEEPETEGVFPWWMIVVAFIIGLAAAMVIGEARLRKQKGKEEDEAALPPEEDTLEAVEIEGGLEDVEVEGGDAEVPDVEDSDLAAITLEGLTEMDEPGPGTSSEW
ncbi:MAG: PKD domain-containing protein, partial [Candidatus Thermoplasmatota archaeon]|nr:PKD domain-containing protein [Candidatus Thermoplasmatota archaeon]